MVWLCSFLMQGREIGGGGGEMGDMGARDPTQQEVEFGFQDRVRDTSRPRRLAVGLTDSG